MSIGILQQADTNIDMERLFKLQIRLFMKPRKKEIVSPISICAA